MDNWNIGLTHLNRSLEQLQRFETYFSFDSETPKVVITTAVADTFSYVSSSSSNELITYYYYMTGDAQKYIIREY